MLTILQRSPPEEAQERLGQKRREYEALTGDGNLRKFLLLVIKGGQGEAGGPWWAEGRGEEV
jgi:hypothetical protein